MEAIYVKVKYVNDKKISNLRENEFFPLVKLRTRPKKFLNFSNTRKHQLIMEFRKGNSVMASIPTGMNDVK